ncbi:hypothetical protein EV426DRAFT_267339 [Tirmania nivea]|nr:hypothetical protein EV426DRAFT_267339 [Tirmania nivea]
MHILYCIYVYLLCICMTFLHQRPAKRDKEQSVVSGCSKLRRLEKSITRHGRSSNAPPLACQQSTLHTSNLLLAFARLLIWTNLTQKSGHTYRRPIKLSVLIRLILRSQVLGGAQVEGLQELVFVSAGENWGLQHIRCGLHYN